MPFLCSRRAVGVPPIAALIPLLLAGPLSAQGGQATDASEPSARDVALGQVVQKLTAWDERMAAEGYTRVGSLLEGTNRQGEVYTSMVWFVAGRSYRVASVCDDDCTDLDLAVKSTDGATIVDLTGERAPAAALDVTAPGPLRVEVTMAACSVEPCLHATAVYEQVGTAQAASPGLGSGLNERGSLDDQDSVLSGGEYYDIFEVTAQAGDAITVDMRSSEFDTWLVLIPPAGGDAINNDNHEDQAGHSRIHTTATQAGTWTIWATSNRAAETGAYELTVTVTPAG